MKDKFDLFSSVKQKVQSAMGSSSFPDFEQDVKENIYHLVESILRKMDIVTREEFDAQQQVLRHTRERLETLEEKVAALEEKFK